MATTAYLRVSTGTQDLANQKLAILEYARRKKFPINEFVEVQISSRKKPHQRGIDGMLERLAPGDRLIVSELSRLGRSLGQVIHIVDELVKRKIRFTAIKESIHFEGKQDLQTKVMVALFGLFAEVGRDLISERTREGLASARAKGRLLGGPKGAALPPLVHALFPGKQRRHNETNPLPAPRRSVTENVLGTGVSEIVNFTPHIAPGSDIDPIVIEKASSLDVGKTRPAS